MIPKAVIRTDSGHANDVVLNAMLLSGADLNVPFDLFGSTFEPSEPSPTDGLPAIPTYPGSLRWRLVQPANGRLTLQAPNPTGAAPPIVSVVWPNQPARIATPPEGHLAFAGTGVSFHVGVEGAAPLVLDWEFNGQPLVGATGPTLFLPAVTPAQAGTYAMVATNAFGAVTSAPVHLNVEQPSSPTLVLQPQGQTAAIGEYVALVVGAGGGQVRLANWWPDPECPIKARVCDTDGLTLLAGDAFRAQIHAGPTCCVAGFQSAEQMHTRGPKSGSGLRDAASARELRDPPNLPATFRSE